MAMEINEAQMLKKRAEPLQASLSQVEQCSICSPKTVQAFNFPPSLLHDPLVGEISLENF